MADRFRHTNLAAHHFCDYNCENCGIINSCNIYRRYLQINNSNNISHSLNSLTDDILKGDINPNEKEIASLLFSSYQDQKVYFKYFIEHLEEFLLHISSLHQRYKKQAEEIRMESHACIIFKRSLSNTLLVRSPILAICGKMDLPDKTISQRLQICINGIQSLISAWMYFFEIAPNFEDPILCFLPKLKNAEKSIAKARQIRTLSVSSNETPCH